MYCFNGSDNGILFPECCSVPRTIPCEFQDHFGALHAHCTHLYFFFASDGTLDATVQIDLNSHGIVVIQGCFLLAYKYYSPYIRKEEEQETERTKMITMPIALCQSHFIFIAWFDSWFVWGTSISLLCSLSFIQPFVSFRSIVIYRHRQENCPADKLNCQAGH